MNFPINQTIPEGIYISLVEIRKKRYNGLTFIGAAKTFNETNYKAEVYVLDFNQDVYGEIVKVTLLKKLRDNQKFATELELVAQMEKDKEQAEEYFKNK